MGWLWNVGFKFLDWCVVGCGMKQLSVCLLMEAGGRGYVGLGAQLCMFQSCTANSNSTKSSHPLKKEIKTGPVPYPALLFSVRGDNCEIVGAEIGGRSEYTAGRSGFSARCKNSAELLLYGGRGRM